MKLLPTRRRQKQDHPFVATYVVGLRYHVKSLRSMKLLFQKLVEGCPVRIVREPRNKHDKNACAVFVGRRQVGYIPRFDAPRIAKQLDRGTPYRFYVLRSQWSGDSIDIQLVGIRTDEGATRVG